MVWVKFTVKLTNAFSVIDKNTGCQVHSDVIKLRMLNSKVRADFLVEMNTSIEIQINTQPMVMRYTYALSNYRNTTRDTPTPIIPIRLVGESIP